MFQCDIQPGDIVTITDKNSFAYGCVGRVLAISCMASGSTRHEAPVIILSLELVSGPFKGFNLSCYAEQVRYAPAAAIVFNGN